MVMVMDGDIGDGDDIDRGGAREGRRHGDGGGEGNDGDGDGW